MNTNKVENNNVVIDFTIYGKSALSKIESTKDAGDFLLFDIACILKDYETAINIDYNNVIYITNIHDVLGGTIYIEDAKNDIQKFLESNSKSIIIMRKGIDGITDDKDYATYLAHDEAELNRLGFRSINCLCGLEYSIPFIYLNNEPSFAIFKEILSFTYRENPDKVGG